MTHIGTCPFLADAIATRGMTARSMRLAAFIRAKPKCAGPFGNAVGRISIPAPPSRLPSTLSRRYPTASEGSSKYTPSATTPPHVPDCQAYSTPPPPPEPTAKPRRLSRLIRRGAIVGQALRHPQAGDGGDRRDNPRQSGADREPSGPEEHQRVEPVDERSHADPLRVLGPFLDGRERPEPQRQVTGPRQSHRGADLAAS